MEAIALQLQPYKEVVGNWASFVTIAQFFTGILICRTIHKNRSTEGISSLPFVGGIIIGILVLKYAIILEDKAMFQVNVAAIIINLIYIAIFHIYCKSKWEELYKKFLIGCAIIVAVFAYLQVESPKHIDFRYGLIVTLLSLTLLGSPLLELKDIIKKEDASSIPFPLAFMGNIVSFLWLLYGIILQNGFMIVQNLIGVLLCTIQISLCFIYPGKKKAD